MPQSLHIIVHAKNSAPDSHVALQPRGPGGPGLWQIERPIASREAEDQTPEREPASKALVADLWKPAIRLRHTNVWALVEAQCAWVFMTQQWLLLGNQSGNTGGCSWSQRTALGEAGCYHAPRMLPRHTECQIGPSWKAS